MRHWVWLFELLWDTELDYTPRILLMVCSAPHSLCDLKDPEHPKTSHRGGDVYRWRLFFLFNLTRLPFENGFMGFHILALEVITRSTAPPLKSSAAERWGETETQNERVRWGVSWRHGYFTNVCLFYQGLAVDHFFNLFRGRPKEGENMRLLLL